MNATSVTSIFSNMRFEGSFENTTMEKSWTNAISVTMHLPKHAIWRLIWKHTMEKIQTNPISVTLLLLEQAISEHIENTQWTKVKNATFVTMHLLIQAIWGLIWKHTVEVSQTNATSVTMHLPKHTILRLIWKHTDTGWFFLLVTPRKVLNMELVPPKSEKSSPKIAISHLKMWKSKSEPVRPYFFAKLQQIGKVWQTLTWTFTFLEEILLSSVNLVIFYYWAGPVSYLQLYWADQSKKPPCSISVEKNTQWR